MESTVEIFVQVRDSLIDAKKKKRSFFFHKLHSDIVISISSAKGYLPYKIGSIFFLQPYYNTVYIEKRINENTF